MQATMEDFDFIEKLKEKIPLIRVGFAEEIAYPVHFLLNG